MIRIELGPFEGKWRVAVDYGEQGYSETFLTKFFALRYAAKTAKEIHEKSGETVSLKVKKKNGRYQEERTYGLDPARTPG